MNFKVLFEKYKNNTASEEERKIVEEEIEKLKVLNEYMDESFDLDYEIDIKTNIDQNNKGELYKIRKSVKRRNRIIILSSVSIVLIIMVVFHSVIAPMLNKLYYNPDQKTYSMTNDLSIILDSHVGLHYPNGSLVTVLANNTGIGKYSITISKNNTFEGKTEYYYGDINKGKLDIESAFWRRGAIVNFFVNATYPPYYMREDEMENVIKRLENAPPYTLIEAYISFEELLSMNELAEIMNVHKNIHWIGIRNSGEYKQVYPLIGISNKGGFIYEELNELYPHFNTALIASKDQITGDILEQNFRSSLQFQINHSATLETLSSNFPTKAYYENTLVYINENGIKTYGVVVQGTPDTILELTQLDGISGIRISNSKFYLPYYN
ncbi:sigma factor regulator [Natranaerovirga pectinivora]|uniref:Sigma factor regulator n=1 Tax=Natranaerovirga pectinivora TaxID=682400 RepID=A0A4R3MS52_9FIRM|nr:anti sigma factor C-terminal domain-containing protein [Natranaerovirga pectinivora]TCT17048.1 sigma factor regulator [Natranaerovirga pectinivora]